ncbi:NADH dehydrogenase (ubiquinone) complex I, assembly factor 6 [Clonorchis sinensis]|uniref:NADH dehydrogenase (Ubiquinone) complex I, assembly factor 6 n=1 Tax=Clonorchis sinensis TaxID=79923 RepID=A0A8T1N2Z4_CLOSI|nr:NADH dehydrogenase (ubiquinone) complex I, assembly factor 6 [Clonorchis sinensis]
MMMVVCRSAKVSPVRFLTHSAALVRENDRENYFCTLLLPTSRQKFVMALRAFNIELAQIRDRINNADQAKFRFQFWRDAVNSLFEPNLGHRGTPIERELSESTVGLKLSKYHFTQLIDARQRHFNECAFDSLRAAQTYAEETNAPIHYLICEAYGLRSLAVDHALNHLGRAQGLVTLIRGAVPLAHRRRVILLPLDLLNQHHLSQELALRLLRSPPSESTTEVDRNLCDLFFNLATVAREQAITASRLASEHLTDLRVKPSGDISGTDQLTRSLLPRLMLPLVPLIHFLHQFERKAHFDPRRLSPHPNGLLPLQLSWTAWRSRIPSVAN